jgi:hypothetical protein
VGVIAFVLFNAGLASGATGTGFDAKGEGLGAVALFGARLGVSKKEKSAFAQGSPEPDVNLDRSPRLDLLAAFGTKLSMSNGLGGMEPPI